jgi:hypothetical protein
MSNQDQVQRALVDVALTFGQACEAPIDAAARDKIAEAFHVSVGKEIQAGRIVWTDPAQRDFVLEKVRDFADKVSYRAKHGGTGTVTVDSMKQLAVEIIPVWEEDCVLPDVAPEHNPLGLGCVSLLTFFKKVRGV